MDRVYKNKDELLQIAKNALHVPFGKLNKSDKLDSVKGGVGQMVEESVFEYAVNSNSDPDIPNLGVEIKTTPVIKKQNGELRAKERLVLGIINYMEENLDSFYDSHFWYKNKDLLILFYEHNLKLPKSFWEFFEFLDYQWPEEDLEIIKQDWQKIVNKIKAGKAHELSESDTMYLGACTKGATAESSEREQPYSDVKAKQRAYSLKQSYMNYIVREYVLGNRKSERIIKSTDLLKENTFEDIIMQTVKPYIGKTQLQLVNELGITPSKQTNASIINKILKVNEDVENTEEFQKANIIVKTIRIEANGNIKESMSFPTFKFKEIIQQNWEDSDFYNILSSARFMFVIFQKTDNTEETSIFKGIKFWHMPEEDIDEAQKCWEDTKKRIVNGLKFTPTTTGYKNDLPGQADNRVAHVRPHASKSYYYFDDKHFKGDRKDGDELPDGRWMTKQCFWLNRDYIKIVICGKD